MAKDKIVEYDATANNNTVVGDVNLAENSMNPSDVNNAIREVMSHQKEAFGSGTPLYVDQANNRVGVNKTPTVALDVNGALSVSGALTQDGGAVFNEGSADVDFRVESNNLTHALFVNGADGKIGIGESVPSEMLHIKDDTNDDAFGGLIIKSNNGTANVKYGWRGADGSDQLRLATGGNLALNIDSAGAVTKPLQPAFQVGTAAEQSNIALNTHVTIVFGTEIFDQNADVTSNTFTSPVTGKYQLNVNVRTKKLDSAATYVHVRIVTSNRVYGTIFDPDFGQDADYWSLNMAILADMDASDTAHVTIYQQSGTQQMDIVNDAGASNFSGYLVA